MKAVAFGPNVAANCGVSIVLAIALAGCGSESTASATKPEGGAALQPSGVASAASSAVVASEPLPKQILAWADKMRAECRSVDGRPKNSGLKPDIIADFNGDGRQDYVVADGFMECDGALTYFTSGQVPNYTIFVSSAKGYREAGFSSIDPKLGKFDGRDVLILSTGGPGAYERPFDTYAFGWNGSEMADLAFYDAKGQRVNADGTRLGGGGWVKAAFPALPKGFYAKDGICNASPQTGTWLYLTDKEWIEGDDMTVSSNPIVGIERNGPTRYRFKARFEDEAGRAETDNIDITVVDAAGFKSTDRYFSHCEVGQVPSSIRRVLSE